MHTKEHRLNDSEVCVYLRDSFSHHATPLKPPNTLKLINSGLVTTLVVRKVDNVVSIRWIAQNILLTRIHWIAIYPLEKLFNLRTTGAYCSVADLSTYV